jgi:hypothetical protein
LLVGIAILLASLISLRLGLSIAIIELILGVLFGNLGVIHVESWMTLVAVFGGILQQHQSSDGSFQSIYSADYVLRALGLLAVPPLFDPDNLLHSQLKRTLGIVSRSYYELSSSLLQSLAKAVAILAFRYDEPAPEVKSAVAAAVREHKRSQGGFDVDHPSIYSTYNAVQALPFSQSDCLAGVAQWRRCEWKTGGFSQPHEYAQLPR